MKLAGLTAIVTGAGRGIGEAIAVAFAQHGARLAIAARTRSELDAVAAKVSDIGSEVIPIVTDVSNREQVARLVTETLRVWGTIDILVNNAGIYGPIGPFVESDLDEWRLAIDINLGGTLHCTQAVLPHMISRRQGKIINLSGGGATSPLPNLTAYSVSKTAVVRLTENLAEELKGYNIQVNAIAPGAVDTRLQDQLLRAGDRAGGDLHSRIKKMRDTGEGGVPPTLAAALAVFLASNESDGLTGKLISAPHDPWREWAGRGLELSSTPMYTLRRMDPFTIAPLKTSC